jgi:hypothetical protein
LGTVVAEIGFPEKDQLDSNVAEVNSDNREIETLEEVRRERKKIGRKRVSERVCVKLRYSFDAACFFFLLFNFTPNPSQLFTYKVAAHRYETCQ